MNHLHASKMRNNATCPGGSTLLLMLLLCLPAQALAQEPAPGEPGLVEIESDQAEFEQQSGVSRYQGNVSVRRGESIIEGDDLVITPDGESDYLHFSMRGNPATYEEARPGQLPMTARARHMQYSEIDDLLLLEGEARVSRGRDVLHGEQIRYERGAGRIRATGGDSPDGRVRIMINPDEGD